MSAHVPLPLAHSPKHSREIRYETCKIDETHIQIRAELIDRRAQSQEDHHLLHHMVVRLTVRDDLYITQADFLTLRGPFLDCLKHTVTSDALVGLNAGHGFTKKIYELYGKEKSCSHIVTLLAGLAAAIRQGMAFSLYFPRADQDMTEEGKTAYMRSMAKNLVDSCMVWAHDSDVQKDIMNGDSRRLEERMFPNFWKQHGGK